MTMKISIQISPNLVTVSLDKHVPKGERKNYDEVSIAPNDPRFRDQRITEFFEGVLQNSLPNLCAKDVFVETSTNLVYDRTLNKNFQQVTQVIHTGTYVLQEKGDVTQLAGKIAQAVASVFPGCREGGTIQLHLEKPREEEEEEEKKEDSSVFASLKSQLQKLKEEGALIPEDLIAENAPQSYLHQQRFARYGSMREEEGEQVLISEMREIASSPTYPLSKFLPQEESKSASQT